MCKLPKMDKFNVEVIKSHNKYRRQHNVPALRYSKELSALAQRWADNLSSINVLIHSNDIYKGEKLGENVARVWRSIGAEHTGHEVTDEWYNEGRKYDFELSRFTTGVGHFTQVVWKDSKEIGVGKSTTRDGVIFVVCNYYPSGNVYGKFKQNVIPPKSSFFSGLF